MPKWLLSFQSAGQSYWSPHTVRGINIAPLWEEKERLQWLSLRDRLESPPHPPIQCCSNSRKEVLFQDRFDPPSKWNKYCTTFGKKWKINTHTQHWSRGCGGVIWWTFPPFSRRLRSSSGAIFIPCTVWRLMEMVVVFALAAMMIWHSDK